MSNSKNMVWLSSYPKSGNTWFRIFLANLLSLAKSAKPIDLNHVDHLINDHIATSRVWVNQACGFNSAWLTEDELDALMPTLYTWHQQQTTTTYHKIHRAYTYVGNDQPLIPLGPQTAAIYFIRNPLDIAISLANHFFFSFDDAIKMMADKSYALHHYSLRQILLSWSMHVTSWAELKTPNILFMRYEDMLMNPIPSFTQAVEFLQLDVTSTMIEQAISYSSFDKLKQFENDIGFMDKPPQLKHFFRKGIAGDWQTTLTANQIQKIIDDHGDVMQKFGYLNKYKQPIIG